MRTLHRIGAGLLAVTVAGGLAACSDDADDSADTTTTQAPDDVEDTAGDEAFCGAVVEFNGAVLEVELDETSSEADVIAAGEGLAPTFQTIADNAPADLAAPVEELNAAVQGLTTGDAEAFNANSTFATYSTFLSGAVEACAFETLAVTTIDYAFEGLPETIEAGTVAFEVTNTSEAEEHELVIFRKADGEALSFEEILNLGEEEAGDKIVFTGAGFAPLGGPPGSVLATLEPGSYAAVCFLPVGGAEDAPPHFVQGMLQEFTVE